MVITTVFFIHASFIYQNKVKSIWHCIITTTASSPAVPSVLPLASTKTRKTFSPQTQQGLVSGHFPYQTIKQMSSSDVMIEAFRGRFCLQGVRAAIISKPLAESRPNPSGPQIISQT